MYKYFRIFPERRRPKTNVWPPAEVCHQFQVSGEHTRDLITEKAPVTLCVACWWFYFISYIKNRDHLREVGYSNEGDAITIICFCSGSSVSVDRGGK